MHSLYRKFIAKNLILPIFTFLLTTVPVVGQTGVVIPGPYGIPQMVLNEAGQWSAPIEVFSDSESIVYIADITQPGWAQWHAEAFKQTGQYMVIVYTYKRKERGVAREVVYVDTRANTAVVQSAFKPTIRIDLQATSQTNRAVAARITAIVKDAVAHFNGPPIDRLISAGGQLTRHNSRCLEHRPECNAPLDTQTTSSASGARPLDGSGIIHIAADMLIANHPRMKLLCAISERCSNVHVTAELVDSPSAASVIRGFTIVRIKSGLEPTGNNSHSDADYAAEAKADPAGAKLAFHEGAAKYRPNRDGTYTVVYEVYDPKPRPNATATAASLQEARHLTIDAAIESYVRDVCTNEQALRRAYCN